jgi:hypothetical protein
LVLTAGISFDWLKISLVMEYNFVNFLLDEILGLFDFYFDIEIFASEFKSAKLSLLL